MCMSAQVNSPYVTPNCPTLVCKTPVLYSIQFDVQKTAWHAVKMTKTSVVYNLVA